MKKFFASESGAAAIIEATIIFPIVFLCVIFLIFSGFTFVQKAVLQSTADRLSEYIARCIAYPGYNEIVDPFYEPAKSTDLNTRIGEAMKVSDPYRYVAGIFGLYSETKKMSQSATKAMLDNGYLKSVSFLKPSSQNVEYPPELASLKPQTKDGYVCAISASTSRITVYLGQNFIFADFFRMIGLNGKKQMIYGKSTSNVTDVPEMVRLVDFSFDTVENVVNAIGGDKGAALIEKIKTAIRTISSNK